MDEIHSLLLQQPAITQVIEIIVAPDVPDRQVSYRQRWRSLNTCPRASGGVGETQSPQNGCRLPVARARRSTRRNSETGRCPDSVDRATGSRARSSNSKSASRGNRPPQCRDCVPEIKRSRYKRDLNLQAAAVRHNRAEGVPRVPRSPEDRPHRPGGRPYWHPKVAP